MNEVDLDEVLPEVVTEDEVEGAVGEGGVPRRCVFGVDLTGIHELSVTGTIADNVLLLIFSRMRRKPGRYRLFCDYLHHSLQCQRDSSRRDRMRLEDGS